MRVIFLDMDGVMNSTRSAIGLGGYGDIRPVGSPKQTKTEARLDPVAVGILKRIVTTTHAKIVISSTWRFRSEAESIDRFNTLFRALEFPEVCIGSTCHVPSGFRGEEIRRWVRDHPDVEDYVILDDDSDMHEDQKSHFFKCDGRVGLAYEQFEAIMKRWK
jgi:hypothetical protein